jgi:hypothetical protein
MRMPLAVGLLALGAVLLAVQPAVAQNQASEPSLAQLLSAPPARPDDAAQLALQLAQLEKRPFARFGASALNEARAALDSLPALRANKAAPEAIERRKELVWAALLLADRLMARAELAAALHVLELRARQVEAAAKQAEQARDAAEAAALAVGATPGGTAP